MCILYPASGMNSPRSNFYTLIKLVGKRLSAEKFPVTFSGTVGSSSGRGVFENQMRVVDALTDIVCPNLILLNIFFLIILSTIPLLLLSIKLFD